MFFVNASLTIKVIMLTLYIIGKHIYFSNCRDRKALRVVCTTIVAQDGGKKQLGPRARPQRGWNGILDSYVESNQEKIWGCLASLCKTECHILCIL